MKLKKFGASLYIAAVTTVLLIPASLMFLPDRQSKQNENRELTAFPAWQTEEDGWNPSFFEQLGNWFSEHFAFRSQMVTAYGDLTRELLSTSSEHDVIVGNDGWLYYTPTVNDITGVRTLSDTDIRHMTRVLQMMQEFAAQHNTRFIFACAPNKGSIYPEHLPARYLQTEGSNNLDLLHDALRETGVEYCDLRSVLRNEAANREELLYHKLDTHWNNDGAMLGYQALMETAGLDDCGYGNLPRTEADDWNGDLWKMLSPDHESLDHNTYYELPNTHKPVGRYRGEDDLTITMQCENGEGSLLMFRDSFCRALLPMFTERFANSVFIRAEHVPIDRITQTQTDFVIYELVERNLKDLICSAPMMPAPSVTPDGQAAIAPEAEPILLKVKREADYVHFFGTYDSKLADGDAVYCAVIDSETGERNTYEAFPCYEPELEGTGENGFSFYLPAESAPQNGTLTVFIQREGLSVQAGEAAFSLHEEEG